MADDAAELQEAYTKKLRAAGRRLGRVLAAAPEQSRRRRTPESEYFTGAIVLAMAYAHAELLRLRPAAAERLRGIVAFDAYRKQDRLPVPRKADGRSRAARRAKREAAEAEAAAGA